MPPNYLSIPENCFKLLFSSQVTSYANQLPPKKIYSEHRQSLLDVLSVLLFYSSCCKILNSVEIYVIIIYDRWVACANVYLNIDCQMVLPTQPAFACSKLTKETLEQGVEYVHS